MDVERYKKFALSKINEENMAKNVKYVIKNEKNKEQNYREGVKWGDASPQNPPAINRKNLFKLGELISDVNSNKNRYNFKNTILDNLERLNYNILRLINKPPPIPPPPLPQPQPIPPQPQPQLLPIDYGGDDDDDFVFPPPPPPIDYGDDFVFPPPPPPIDNDDFVFPPPPIDNDDFVFPPSPIDNEGEPFPTLPIPPPPPPTEPLTNIIRSARENLLDEIRNPKKLKTTKPQEPKKTYSSNEGQILLNTINELAKRRSIIAPSSDEDEDEDEDWE